MFSPKIDGRGYARVLVDLRPFIKCWRCCATIVLCPSSARHISGNFGRLARFLSYPACPPPLHFILPAPCPVTSPLLTPLTFSVYTPPKSHPLSCTPLPLTSSYHPTPFSPLLLLTLSPLTPPLPLNPLCPYLLFPFHPLLLCLIHLPLLLRPPSPSFNSTPSYQISILYLKKLYASPRSLWACGHQERPDLDSTSPDLDFFISKTTHKKWFQQTKNHPRKLLKYAKVTKERLQHCEIISLYNTITSCCEWYESLKTIVASKSNGTTLKQDFKNLLFIFSGSYSKAKIIFLCLQIWLILS